MQIDFSALFAHELSKEMHYFLAIRLGAGGIFINRDKNSMSKWVAARHVCHNGKTECEVESKKTEDFSDESLRQRVRVLLVTIFNGGTQLRGGWWIEFSLK